MKIDVSNDLTISGGSISSSKYGISEENAPFVIKMMIDNLYSNKPLAIIREYITNAWDAHVDAGISDKPIEITVPTMFRPTLCIRDFGKGLSQEDVLHFYTQMADSRKRHTDDFVGGFGIGCKCAFCYVPSFTVTSFHNGKKMVFNASSSGAVPEMNLFYVEDSTETGFMVQIDVKSDDVYTFRNTLMDFLQFFNPKPIIISDSYFSIPVCATKLLEMDDWYCVDDRYSKNQIILGNVPYNFDVSMLKLNADENKLYESLHTVKFVIQMSPNDLNVTLNRESLEYTPKTINALKSKYLECLSEVKIALIAKYNNVTSVWEAKLLYKKLGQKFNLFPEVDGVKISSYNANVSDFKFKERMCKNSKRWSSESSVICCDSTVIFVARPNITANSIRPRIEDYFEINGIDSECSTNKYHYFVFRTNEDADEFVNSTHIRGANIVELDTIPYIRVTAKTSRIIRIQSPCYVYQHSYYGNGTFTDCKKDLGNDSGVYVPIAHYKPHNMYHLGKMDTYEKIKTELGLDNIYGIKNVDLPKLGDNWKKLDVYLQEYFDSYVAEHPDALLTYVLTRHIPRAFKSFNEKLDFDYKYKDLYAKIANNSDSWDYRVSKIRSLVGYGATYSCPEADLLIKAHKECVEEYSFLDLVDTHSNPIDNQWKIIHKYIKMHELA
jgi:hypothetical protein